MKKTDDTNSKKPATGGFVFMVFTSAVLLAGVVAITLELFFSKEASSSGTSGYAASLGFCPSAPAVPDTWYTDELATSFTALADAGIKAAAGEFHSDLHEVYVGEVGVEWEDQGMSAVKMLYPSLKADTHTIPPSLLPLELVATVGQSDGAWRLRAFQEDCSGDPTIVHPSVFVAMAEEVFTADLIEAAHNVKETREAWDQ